MSKIVVVFSTYYNYPIYQDKLFNKSTCKVPKVGKFLKDFFVKRLKEDKEDTVWGHLLDYLNEEQKQIVGQNIESARRNDIELIESKIKEEVSIVNQSLQEEKRIYPDKIDDADFECWIDDLDINDNTQSIKKLYQQWFELISNEEEYKISFLREKIDLDYDINNKGDQEVYDIYLSSAKIPEDKPYPWLYHRMSYYELNSSDSAVAVYAVWPIDRPSSPTQDGVNDNMISCEWIDVLKKQFLSLNNDCETIYLCLHGKDIYGSNSDSGKTITYKLYGPYLEEKVNVIVILFQHPKPIGSDLLYKEGRNSHEVKDFVEKETLKLGLVKLKSTVSPNSIKKTKELLEFYNKYSFCKNKIETALNKLKEYEVCQDEGEKYKKGKELKRTIEDIKENL